MGSEGSHIDLSIIIPSYQHAETVDHNLPFLLAFLKDWGITHEVIVCDDGSTDDGATQAVADKWHCKYVRLPENQGKGAAIRAGMLHATGKVRIFTDADIPFKPDALKDFYHYLTFMNFQVVVGDRNLPESSYFLSVPLIRRIGSRIYAMLVGLCVAGGWYDTQCGLKGFQAKAADTIFSATRINRFGFDVELIYLALYCNFDVKRLPVHLRNQGPSSVRLFRDGSVFFLDLMRLMFFRITGKYRHLNARAPLNSRP